MEVVASFNFNHLILQKGLYVMRKDTKDGVTVTTFDLRMTAPNREPVMDTAPLHTIEHLGATFLRASERSSDIVYFGPMGCRTGCELVMFGDLSVIDVYPLILRMCDYILQFEGEIRGAKVRECGNYLDQNLDMAKYHIAIYKKSLVEDKNFEYEE